MARPIVVIAFLIVGFGKFILFVKKSATNPTRGGTVGIKKNFGTVQKPYVSSQFTDHYPSGDKDLHKVIYVSHDRYRMRTVFLI